MDFSTAHIGNGQTLLRAISGSRAYGLDTPQSDTDIKGIYFLPLHEFYGLAYVPQVASEKNDMVYYELGRFIELLAKNNPNIIELLATPSENILYRHPIMDMVRPEMFLSKLCYDSFAGYALSQIKKASGLNKKIFNPVDKERKGISEFCFVINEGKTTQLEVWLDSNKYWQQDCGLVKINHAKNLYGLFHQSQFTNISLNGIFSGTDANDVSLSSTTEGVKPLVLMSFNKDAYSVYCKEYREYWDWVDKRNDERYIKTLSHGKNYDAKNMMHTFRLLKMSYEIATEGEVNVKRKDRDFLFQIKEGGFSYEELVKMSDSLLQDIKEAYHKSALPDTPDLTAINDLLVKMRKALYAY